ncbi:MAG: DUF3955 domain-containing protein [Gammaproteobacteria bacterium]|uniref:DUF3955 domain-containing protein n=1 Tax=endosymbiont of Bathymodiolus septemdierum str. Myojin knoll TaxID=1303921 RepID=A0A0P0URY5_9GAMM|nr:DUF3955 domain-containing protein [Bathymodiolus septemdierum thioautotrophic gill symbiont]RUA04134.1 MAG: DUF3955 domain-containing protein [Gammaproteobacteria bacterium]BAS67812.1 conserved hypothetical protein [endosymbiont of Bathymodiolus septemdierum str. Myojin knoll]
MKKLFKNILLTVSLFFLCLSIISMLAQQIFYPQYIDAQGVLHETLWVPIGAFSFLLGIATLVIYLLLLILKSIKRWIK